MDFLCRSPLLSKSPADCSEYNVILYIVLFPLFILPLVFSYLILLIRWSRNDADFYSLWLLIGGYQTGLRVT